MMWRPNLVRLEILSSFFMKITVLCDVVRSEHDTLPP
jgi:hypothetical protein